VRPFAQKDQDSKNLFLRPRQAQILQQRLAFVFGAEKFRAAAGSGTTLSTKSSRPAGRKGKHDVKPSEPKLISHSSIWSAMVFGRADEREPAIAADPLRELAHGELSRAATSTRR